MNYNPVTEPVVGATCDALLNSDLIRDRFGSYHVDVLSRNGDTRVSALSSDDGKARVCRTIAITRFLPSSSGIDGAIMDRIDSGGSIGATLRRAGYQVDKQTQNISELDLAEPSHPVLQRMTMTSPATLALHIYTLGIRSRADLSPFATIAELHHPDFLTKAALEELFAVAESASVDAQELGSLRAEFLQIGT